MKEEFIKYLESIGITGELTKKIGTVYEFYKEVFPNETITDIFITDYIKEDGTREYESLWFFSENYLMEAKQFIIMDDFDITPVKNRIIYIELKKQNYDFKKATEKSRFNLSVRLDTGIVGEFKASKENCDYFKDIFRKYIQSNLQIQSYGLSLATTKNEKEVGIFAALALDEKHNNSVETLKKFIEKDK